MRPKIKNKHLIFVGIIILLNIIFPPPRIAPHKYNFQSGEIAPYDVIAPYDFSIPKSDQELYEEKQEIAKRIPPVYVLDNSVPKLVLKKVSGLEAVIDSFRRTTKISSDSIIPLIQKEYAVDGGVIEYLLTNNSSNIFVAIKNDFRGLYTKGIIDKKLPEVRIVTILNRDQELVESIDRLYTTGEAESILVKGTNGTLRKLVQFFVRPNIIYSEELTNERIEAVYSNVPKSKGRILKGEIIVEKHKRLTDETIEILDALESTTISVGTWEIIKIVLFRNLFFLTIMFFIVRLGRLTKQDFLKGKNLYFIALLSVVYLVIGRIFQVANIIYLLPISFFIFLFALYFNLNTALLFTLIFSALFGITLNSVPIFIFLLISGFVAAFSTQTIDSRLSLYRPMIYIGIANIVVILFADLYLSKGNIELAHLGLGISNSIIGSFFFALLLPLFEKLFDFTTDLTLLELGNLNLPIFKEMAMEAPGTYHHSIITGSLAEAGASAIEADPILARVGAYYHDIGKLKKPEYYIENQIGVKNPHDTLKPQMSALVIISHVKDGVDMAKKMGLPRKLISIIEQHHGTTPMEVFYQRALSESDSVDEDSFRYPGPKPKTKEAAVVMLADSVEAAARSDKNITVTKLQKIIKDMIDKKFNDGQLDECPINRHHLELIKTAFLSMLTGVFHPRVGYAANSSDVDNEVEENSNKTD